MTQEDATKVAKADATAAWLTHAVTHTGNARSYNEDAYLCLPHKGLWAVADGMGGHHAGDVASRAVVERLARIDFYSDLARLSEACQAELAVANDQLQAIAADKPNRLCGSTVAVLLARGQRGAVVWAGDSRIYRLAHADGQLELTQLTEDHSKVAALVKQGQLTEAEAERHPDANMITRAVGVRPSLELEMREFDVNEGDTFLICSDGLTRYVAGTSLAKHLGAASVPQLTDALLDATLATAARDNVTIVVVRVTAEATTQTMVNPDGGYRLESSDDPTVLDTGNRRRID